jgi:hypothetical protein
MQTVMMETLEAAVIRGRHFIGSRSIHPEYTA